MSVSNPNLASCCAELYELPVVEYLLGQSFHPGGPKLTRQLASTALVSPRSDVLDVACGNGSSARIIAAHLGATVTACDYSGINLKRAIAASRTAELQSKTRFVRCDAERLPFAPGSFDVSLCECSLCLFDNMETALEQIHYILKPGGRIGISDFFLDAPVPGSLEGLLGRVLCVAGAPSLEGYREALTHAGFDYVRIRTVNWALTDLIRRFRRRLTLLREAPAAARAMLPVEWGDPARVLADLEQFIADGGAGYLIAVGRRS